MEVLNVPRRSAKPHLQRPKQVVVFVQERSFKVNIFRKRGPELERLRTAFLKHRSEFSNL